MKKKFYFDYILMQTLYFVLMGIIYGYGSYTMLQLGYSASQTGLMMSAGSLLSTIIQPIAASVSDKSKKLTLFNVCIIISIASVILSTSTYVQNSVSLITTLSFIGTSGVFAAFEPLVNTVPTILENNGIKINYGIGRAAGSLGYAGANALLGILTAKYAYKAVFFCASLASLLLTIINIKANKDFLTLKTKVNKDTETKQNTSYLEFLKKHKAFVLLMVCNTGIYLGYTMSDNMMYLVVSNVGGSTSDLGLIMAFKACLEVPVIFFYDKIQKIITPKNLLKISAISFVIKEILLCCANSVTMVYIAQLAQMTSLSLEIPSMVAYTSQIMDKDEEVRGQALSIMSVTIASICSAMLSGTISEMYSTSTMLIVACCISSVSVIAYLFVLKIND